MSVSIQKDNIEVVSTVYKELQNVRGKIGSMVTLKRWLLLTMDPWINIYLKVV